MKIQRPKFGQMAVFDLLNLSNGLDHDCGSHNLKKKKPNHCAEFHLPASDNILWLDYAPFVDFMKQTEMVLMPFEMDTGKLTAKYAKIRLKRV